MKKRARTAGGGASGSVRNLRIREDTAKYLLNLDVNSAHYDPKSRWVRWCCWVALVLGLGLAKLLTVCTATPSHGGCRPGLASGAISLCCCHIWVYHTPHKC